jgi:hypothetical protein
MKKIQALSLESLSRIAFYLWHTYICLLNIKIEFYMYFLGLDIEIEHDPCTIIKIII